MNAFKLINKIDLWNNPEGSFDELDSFFKRNSLLDNYLRYLEGRFFMKRFESLLDNFGIERASKIILEDVGINYIVEGVEKIPETPAVYVANHPWGFPESLILLSFFGSNLKSKNMEFKFVSTHHLKGLKGFDKFSFFVDKGFKKDVDVKNNIQNIREILDYTENSQGSLFLFPAGETSYKISGITKDPKWNNLVGRLNDFLDIVPMYFQGPDNGLSYKIHSKINPPLRFLLYGKELLNKYHKERIYLSIGDPIEKESLKDFNLEKRAQYIRDECESLAESSLLGKINF